MSQSVVTDVISAKVNFTVPFHDCDPAGVVWHGNYFRYFELARCAVLDKIDYNYHQMAESGFYWPIVDTNVRYRSTLQYAQQATVTAILREWEFRIVMDYDVQRDEDGTHVTRATTVQLPLTHPEHELVIGAPKILRDRVEHYLANLK